MNMIILSTIFFYDWKSLSLAVDIIEQLGDRIHENTIPLYLQQLHTFYYSSQTSLLQYRKMTDQICISDLYKPFSYILLLQMQTKMRDADFANHFHFADLRPKTDANNVKMFTAVTTKNQKVYVKMHHIKKTVCCPTNNITLQIEKEIQLYNKFDNECVVKLTKIVESQHCLYMAIQRGDVTLDTQIKNLSNFEEIMSIFIDMVIGVSQIYAKGYVHYNLEPSVIQMCSNGTKIGGLQSCIKLSQLKKNIKKSFCKDEKFIAPELLKQNKPFSEKSMIWNLGCIFCLMIFWKFPSEVSKVNESFMIPLQNNKIRPDFYDFLQQILQGCLNPNASYRFSIEDLVRKLQTYKIYKDCSIQFVQICKQKLKYLQQVWRIVEAAPLFSEQNQQQQVENQINYVYLLQKMCFLVNKTQVKIKQVPLESITQYMIKCRIKKLQNLPYWKSNQINAILKYEYRQLFQKYSSISPKHNKQLQKQQFKHFCQQNYQYNETTYLIYQAFLRLYIVNTIKALHYEKSKFQTQNDFNYNSLKNTVFALDFVVTVFQLGSELAEQRQYQNWVKLGYNYIDLIAESPLSHKTVQNFQKILNKIISLKIADEDPN